MESWHVCHCMTYTILMQALEFNFMIFKMEATTFGITFHALSTAKTKLYLELFLNSKMMELFRRMAMSKMVLTFWINFRFPKTV